MDFLKSLFSIAVPIILQNFFSSFVNMVDTIMVGQLGTIEIAAVGLANQIFFILNIVLFGVVSGGSIFIAQYWGKKDFKSIHSTMGITISLSIFISVMFFIAAFFFPSTLMSFYSKDINVIKIGKDYLKAVSFSYLFTGIGFAFAHAERSTEKVKLPMTATIISVIINSILNYFFIFGIKYNNNQIIIAQGVVGAAKATTIARFIEAVILIAIPYIKKYEIATNPKNYFKIQTSSLPRYLKICLPVFFNESLWGIGISLQNAIFARAGTYEIAAFNINGTISNLIWPFFIGAGAASGIIIGKTIGESNYKKARLLAKQTSIFLSIVACFVSVIIIPLIMLLPRFFNVEAQVIKMASFFLFLTIFLYPLHAFNMNIVVGVCRAGGDTIYGLIMDIGFMWAVCIPLGFFSVQVLHLPYYVIFLIVQSENIIKMILGLIRLISGKWLKDLTIKS